MVAGGWMKINNFHSCIMPPWNIASSCTMQFIRSAHGPEIFPHRSLQVLSAAVISEEWPGSRGPFARLWYKLLL